MCGIHVVCALLLIAAVVFVCPYVACMYVLPMSHTVQKEIIIKEAGENTEIKSAIIKGNDNERRESASHTSLASP